MTKFVTSWMGQAQAHVDVTDSGVPRKGDKLTDLEIETGHLGITIMVVWDEIDNSVNPPRRDRVARITGRSDQLDDIRLIQVRFGDPSIEFQQLMRKINPKLAV